MREPGLTHRESLYQHFRLTSISFSGLLFLSFAARLHKTRVTRYDGIMKVQETLYILDGYSLIYRSYFAFIRNPLFTPDGRNSSAVFGFFRTLLAFFNTYGPDYFCVSLDPKGPTFRHEQYPEYKANREKAPDDLHAQVPVIEEILAAMKIPIARVDGYEADDIMASYARICPEKDFRCAIITGDKDLLQLVAKGTTYLKPGSSGYTVMDPPRIIEEWGVETGQILDYLSLTGDSSDNVPGVAGIGPKTASGLLNKYKTLEGIYGHLDELTKSQKAKLEEGRESAFMSRELIKLCDTVPGLPGPEHYRLTPFDKDAVTELLLKEGAKSLVSQLSTQSGAGKTTAAQSEVSGNAAAADEPSHAAEAALLHTEGVIDNKPGSYRAVTSAQVLDEMTAEMEKAGVFAFDIETDSIDPVAAHPVGFCFSAASETGWYVPIRCEGTECLAADTVFKSLSRLFSAEGVRVVGQNIKYDFKVLKRWGIDIGGKLYFDTMVAAWLLDTSANGYGMDELAERHLGYATVHFKDVVEKGKTFDTVPLDQAVAYAAEDADITLRLYNLYSKLLTDAGLDELFYKTEMPLIRILGNMELEGISLDGKSLEAYGRELDVKLDGIEKEIYALCGKEFNINSPKQLQEILFVDRKLTPVKKTKTGYSTDVSVLEMLASEDPVPEKILVHRTLKKLKSTYVDVLPGMVNPETGRLHTSFNVTGTATGRLSSTNPNLQNIPIKSEEGRRIRDAFIPRSGCTFLSADYSQIELVVFAHLSGDPGLKTAFIEGKDVHARTASLIFELPEEMVAQEQRRIAKTINFGVIYGMSAFRLSNELKIPRKHAAAFIDSYFERYGKVKEFMARVVKEAEDTGYSRTLLGRMRKIPGITSRNKTEKMAAERIAVNTPVQGSAADIMKLAMIAIDGELNGKGLETKMILQVHDELIFEVPEKELPQAEALVRSCMEQVFELTVPLRVSIESGSSWGQLH